MVAETCSVGATVLVLTAVVAAKAAVESAIIASTKILEYFLINFLLCSNPRPGQEDGLRTERYILILWSLSKCDNSTSVIRLGTGVHLTRIFSGLARV